ncbi:MAG TPA: HAMP domain-containing sensor histidine kinase, partial [Candidatus Saccharimonadales bacterium]|nr:HAMP domain-containing sensor histidine kinase [Candidatus Saccharimonadales bacterium]
VLMPKLKIDITKIKEVISNMVDNSIKYTQKGGITVKLETNTTWDTEHKEHKESVRVIVSDTGIGMDAEEIGMIFEKFQRGKQVAHYHTDGTGLGMYIGKKIVAEHKGRIWAESDGKGMGSRFILELPVG